MLLAMGLSGSPPGAPSRQQGAGPGFPSHLPTWSILGIPGQCPPLASLQVGGLALGLSCQDPPGLDSFSPLGLALEDCHLPGHGGCAVFEPLQHPPLLHGSPTPQLGTGGRVPADRPLGGEHEGTDYKSLQDPEPAPQKPGGCSPQCPASILQKPMGAQPGSGVDADPLCGFGGK